jgi:FkbM family methyltransferase
VTGASDPAASAPRRTSPVLRRARLVKRSVLRSLTRLDRRGLVERRDASTWVQGVRLVVPDPNDSSVSRRLVEQGITEPAFTRAARSATRPGAVVLDVGASIGYFTCLFSRWAGPSGRVVAVEPWPSALRYLEANVRRNGFDTVRIVRGALFDVAGAGHVEPPGYRLTLGPGSEPEAIDVEAIRFDDVAEELLPGRLDIVKMDIEGAELRALSGMRDTLRRWRPTLLLEVHPGFLPLYGDTVVALGSFLDELGYERRIVEPGATEADGHHLVASPRVPFDGEARGPAAPAALP